MNYFLRYKNLLIALCAVVVLIIIGAAVSYEHFFGAPEKDAKPELLVVARNTDQGAILQKLKDGGFIKSPWAFTIAFGKAGGLTIKPGGYIISKSMDAWEVAGVLASEPAMKWIVIPEGLRKEEIADILGDSLGWSKEEKKKWITIDTATRPDYFEGVYFPDTYLISKDEAPSDVAKRLQAKFEEKFAPLAKEALLQNIRWVTALKVASLVQREAAGVADMPLIAGILWNRLLADMPLGIDATIQYVRGDVGSGWWAPINVADKKIDSPYNTYKYKGLPPHPIANPGLDAIRAVLHSTDTECLYYLHDAARQIHCAKSYEEHKKNIATYLQ